VAAILERLAVMRAASAADVAVKVKGMAWALGVKPREAAGEVASYDRIAGPIMASVIADAARLV